MYLRTTVEKIKDRRYVCVWRIVSFHLSCAELNALSLVCQLASHICAASLVSHCTRRSRR